MNDTGISALLPAGLRDVLPPDAGHEADAIERIMARFAMHGYERVKPPLIEFEETLLGGTGAAMARHSFRLMDPVSQHMLAVRADMTLQVARIATSRLGAAPRPLRLSYSGQVLRVRGTQIRPERQFAQAGFELIGADSAAADAEAILLAARALAALGIKDVSVDLSLPQLVPSIYGGLTIPEGVREALDHKDVGAVRAEAKDWVADMLIALIAASGPAKAAVEQLAALELQTPTGNALRARLAEVVTLVAAAAPELMLTVDAVENRGFEYHTGIAFTLFSRRNPAELGRGGRYLVGTETGHPEAATGATLFLDTVLEAAPDREALRRVFVPAGASEAVAEKLRGEGWVTVAGLAPVTDDAAEAARLRCSHRMAADGQPIQI